MGTERSPICHQRAKLVTCQSLRNSPKRKKRSRLPPPTTATIMKHITSRARAGATWTGSAKVVEPASTEYAPATLGAD